MLKDTMLGWHKQRGHTELHCTLEQFPIGPQERNRGQVDLYCTPEQFPR